MDEESPLALPINVREALEEDPAVLHVYENNWASIRTHHQRNNRVQDTYNFRFTSFSNECIRHRVDEIYSDQNNYFKLNMSFGIILSNRVTGELRYFHSSHNNSLFLERPVVVSSRDDIDLFLDQFMLKDVEEVLLHSR